MPVLNEIAAHLQALGVGVLGTTLFIGSMPATPDVCVALFEYGGLAPEKGFGTPGNKWETPAIQVVARGVKGDYAGPRAKVAVAYAELSKIEAELLGSTFYHHIHAVQAPFLMRRDDSERVYMAVNFLAQKDPS